MATWGKPKYGNNIKTIKSLKEDESVVVRILPPMKSLMEKGIWAVLHKQHFGYNVPQKQDPSKLTYYTFYCVEKMDFRTRTIVEDCAECNEIANHKDQLESTKRDLKGKGKTDEQIAVMVKPFVSWIMKHNLDTKYYMNVKYQDGTFGTIKIPYKAKKALDGLVDKLMKQKRPIDPIDPEQGVLFQISRKGKGFNTEYSVEIVEEEIEKDGEVFKRTKMAPLTVEDATKADEACYDLSDVGIRKLPREKIEVLVKSKGEPEVVEAVFKTPERTTTPTTSAKTEAKPSVDPKDPAVLARLKQIEQARETKGAEEKKADVPTEAKESAVPTPEPTPVSEEIDPSTLGDEEFMALYGPGAQG